MDRLLFDFGDVARVMRRAGKTRNDGSVAFDQFGGRALQFSSDAS